MILSTNSCLQRISKNFKVVNLRCLGLAQFALLTGRRVGARSAVPRPGRKPLDGRKAVRSGALLWQVSPVWSPGYQEWAHGREFGSAGGRTESEREVPFVACRDLVEASPTRLSGDLAHAWNLTDGLVSCKSGQHLMDLAAKQEAGS